MWFIFDILADMSFLNGNAMSRVMESKHKYGIKYCPVYDNNDCSFVGSPWTLHIPFRVKNDASAIVSKNKPQPYYKSIHGILLAGN